MTDSTQTHPFDGPRGSRLRRRQVVAGGLWVTPVVVGAAPAPAMAASCGGGRTTLALSATCTDPLQGPNSNGGYSGRGGGTTLTFDASFTVAGGRVPTGTTFSFRLTPEAYWDELTMVRCSLPEDGYTPATDTRPPEESPTPTFTWGGNGCIAGKQDTRYTGEWTTTRSLSARTWSCRFSARLRYNAKNGGKQNPFYPTSLSVQNFVRLAVPQDPCTTSNGPVIESDTQGFYTIRINGSC